jgi:multidrug efflux pump subunit AcrA (membrane-fusion protein)
MLAKLKNLLNTASPRGKRFLAGAGFIAAALLASVSIFATGPNPKPTPPTEKAWPVSVIEVMPATLQPAFTVFGKVESSNVAHLKTDLNAEVASVHVREGDWVAAGDLLLTLNDQELQLDLLERRADLAQLEAGLASTRLEQDMISESTEHYRSMRHIAQKKLDRHQDLMTKRLISQSLLDEVTAQANQAIIGYQSHMRTLADFPNQLAAQQAGVDRARTQVSQVQLDIDKTRITAPCRGPILSVNVAPGDRSMMGATLADIADADAFEVRVQIPQRFGPRLQASLLPPPPPHQQEQHQQEQHQQPHQQLRQQLRQQEGVVVARTNAGQLLELTRLSSQVKAGQSGLDAFFELEARQGASHTALGRLLELTITLPAEDAVIALPVQSIYQNNRVYAIRESRAANSGTSPAKPEYRLEAITIERVGEFQGEDGQHKILVRSPAISPGQRIITTQLPRAITGLLVEPA